ncbi:MAG: CarD family transcriptional regulator [Candidatus Babeliales bacterium]
MFKLNDNVVYPGHGVAVINEIVEKTVGETVIRFLKLDFLYKDMTILVPMYNANAIGLRHPSKEQEIATVLQELAKKPEKKIDGADFTPSGWNRRNKDYQNKIQGGNILEIARIYRDLMFIAQHKELSFGERTLQQTTEELIAQEMQVIQGCDRSTVIQTLRGPFKMFSYTPEQPAQTLSL